MKAHSAHAIAIVLLSVMAAGCAQNGTLLTGDLNTSSIDQQAAAQATPKANPLCLTLASQIEALNKDGIPEKVAKAAAKKYRLKNTDLAKADELNKANTEFQTKCSDYPPPPTVAVERQCRRRWRNRKSRSEGSEQDEAAGARRRSQWLPRLRRRRRVRQRRQVGRAICGSPAMKRRGISNTRNRGLMAAAWRATGAASAFASPRGARGGESAAFRLNETLWGCVPQLRVVKNHLVSL